MRSSPVLNTTGNAPQAILSHVLFQIAHCTYNTCISLSYCFLCPRQHRKTPCRTRRQTLLFQFVERLCQDIHPCRLLQRSEYTIHFLIKVVIHKSSYSHPCHLLVSSTILHKRQYFLHRKCKERSFRLRPW